MAIVARRLRSGKTAYWIAFGTPHGKVWEHGGSDKARAKSLEAQRKREVKDGTYRRDKMSGAATFGRYALAWFDKRRTRNVRRERAQFETYVLPRTVLMDTPIKDLRPSHVSALVAELKEATSEKTGRRISTKLVQNIYGVIHTMLHDARVDELIPVDPCALRRGTFRKRTVAREIYAEDDIRAMCFDDRVPLPSRMWNALAFFTGARQGEICGFRWGDWDPSCSPLGCLTVQRQFDGKLLKTEVEQGEHTRLVPVHPMLEQMLLAWKSGFELVFLRPPRPGDPIVPTDKLRHHTSSTSYKAWLRSCAACGVVNRSIHSSRHTFLTLSRRGGARGEVIERVTHNAKGDIVDRYTHWDWAPLCEAVLCMFAKTPLRALATAATARVDSAVDPAEMRSRLLDETECRRRESKTQPSVGMSGLSEDSADPPPPYVALNRPTKDASASNGDSGQRSGPGLAKGTACPACQGTGTLCVSVGGGEPEGAGCGDCAGSGVA